MENPFWKRATDYLRDDEAFLSVVSSEPVEYYLAEFGRERVLYDRLVNIQGTPGSGKTTIARLFELSAMVALLRNKGSGSHKSLKATLVDCGAIREGCPLVVGCRLPMEADYRDCWELPYDEAMRATILSKFIQARSVLGWLRQLERAGVPFDAIRIIPRADANASLGAIGGTSLESINSRARAVENHLYQLVGSLVAPPLEELAPEVLLPYAPFDVLEAFEISELPGISSVALRLQPLVVLDDAHSLAPSQFDQTRLWLARREIRVARWMLTRLDVLNPKAALRRAPDDDRPGVALGRDVINVKLQGGTRVDGRKSFRRMASDIADRYLSQMPLFHTRQLTKFRDILETEPKKPSDAQIGQLRQDVDKTQQRLQIVSQRRAVLEDSIERYHPRALRVGEDVRLMMLNILMHRYAKRTPQRSLFDEPVDAEPRQPLKVGSALLAAASIQLAHKLGRPYYYGFESIADASTENAEQFLRLAGALVDVSADKLARRGTAVLSPREQDSALRQFAKEHIDKWDFPEVGRVRHLTESIAARCLKETMRPSAWLDSGASSYAILQSDFDSIADREPVLGRVIHFALAYNALLVTPDYDCQNKTWCLLELGGGTLLKTGLTLRRGGFLKGSLEDLKMLTLGEPDA